jgi:AraC family transcriptional activator of pobA
MPERIPNGTDVCARLKQMRRAAMAQHVGRDISCDASAEGRFFAHVAHQPKCRIEAPLAPIPKIPLYLNLTKPVAAMKQIGNTSLEKFYEEAAHASGRDIKALLPPGMDKEVGHFNVFDVLETFRQFKQRNVMPYNRRNYYKISLIRGRNRAEYADKVLEIQRNALLFATPKVPYHYVPLDDQQSGIFCVFTDAFLIKNKSGVLLDELPIFKAGGYPVFEIGDADADEIERVFRKMQRELASDYEFKYDLLRNYVLELIHYGQKLNPAAVAPSHSSAAARIASLFVELLERQFPIESPQQHLGLRTANEYAARLAVHVNHLNKVLKEHTGQTTTALIHDRMVQEAKILLKQTDWNISEIAYSLGFEEVAHFSNFFKKRTSVAPMAFRA